MSCKMDWGTIAGIEEAQAQALAMTADALHSEVVQAQVVPRDEGTLQHEAFFPDTDDASNGEVFLIHSTPYARRMYFHPEYNFQKVHNPNAQGEWFEPWISGEHSEWVQETYAQMLRRIAGL